MSITPKGFFISSSILIAFFVLASLGSRAIGSKFMPPLPTFSPQVSAESYTLPPKDIATVAAEQAEDFYVNYKNGKYEDVGEWMAFAGLGKLNVTSESVAEVMKETQYKIHSINIGKPEIFLNEPTIRAHIPLQVHSESIFHKESTVTLTTVAFFNQKEDKWLFSPIGAVFSISPTQSYSFEKGKIAITKVILGIPSISSREPAFGAWIVFDGSFSPKRRINRVHFNLLEPHSGRSEADPYFEKHDEESGETGMIWDFAILDTQILAKDPQISIQITDLFDTPEFELGKTQIHFEPQNLILSVILSQIAH